LDDPDDRATSPATGNGKNQGKGKDRRRGRSHPQERNQSQSPPGSLWSIVVGALLRDAGRQTRSLFVDHLARGFGRRSDVDVARIRQLCDAADLPEPNLPTPLAPRLEEKESSRGKTRGRANDPGTAPVSKTAGGATATASDSVPS